MSKFMYIGPTINGVAIRNTIYAEPPKALASAIQRRPYLAGLCIQIPNLAGALAQIRRKQGGAYTLYNRALEESAEIQKGEQ